MRVEVRNGDMNHALKVLKKKMFDEGIIRELQERRFYTKPSEKKRKAKMEAIKRAKRERRKQLIEYGF